MENLNKSKNKLFWAALILSALFVVGIPGIIFSAGKSGLLLAFFIACTGGGFFVMPILWVFYGEMVSLERTLFAIEKEHLYTVDLIAQQRGLPQAQVVSQIKKMIEKHYLEGYIFENNFELKLNRYQKLDEIKFAAKCPSCGANVELSDKQARCPYCGCLVNADDKK